MANVIVALDPDPRRRASFLETAQSRIAPLPGLEVTCREAAGWAAIWAASPVAPFSACGKGASGTMLWGDAIDASGRRLGAEDIHRNWSGDGATSWDGFHLAIDVDGSDRLTASVDILGLLPLYHWRSGDVVLVGTSVDAFCAHPAFRAELDTTGLVGILLMNGQVGGRTLWKGVRRLGVRHQLRVRGGNVSERESFALPEADRSRLGMPLEGHLEIMGAVLDDAVARQTVPGEPHGILLSGGMDSRQIAGFLVDHGIPVKALTFGLDTDVEMRCAKRVAKALGVPHETVEIQPSEYLDAAQVLMKAEGLAAGFSNVLDWGMVPHLSRLPARTAIGHVFDGVVGGIHITWAYDPPQREYRFETIFRRFNRWAFSADQLRDLLVPDLHPAIEDTLEEVRQTYEDSASAPNLRAWHFDLLTRQRFHVGAAVWPMTFRTWPMSPIFDREVLCTAASLPASSVGERRLQRELLVARHPHLAAVPIDRNNLNSLPLVPTLGDRLRQKVGDHWHRAAKRLPFGSNRIDERFYYRTFDFDSPGWLEVRRGAEEHRRRIPSVLRREVVDRLLPGPGLRLRADDGIIDSANAKLLLGLALAGDHFGLE